MEVLSCSSPENLENFNKQKRYNEDFKERNEHTGLTQEINLLGLNSPKSNSPECLDIISPLKGVLKTRLRVFDLKGYFCLYVVSSISVAIF